MKERELDRIDPTREKRSISPGWDPSYRADKPSLNNSNNFSTSNYDSWFNQPSPQNKSGMQDTFGSKRNYGGERVEEEVFAVNAKPTNNRRDEPENRHIKAGPTSVVSGMEYNEDEDYDNVQEI